MGGLACGGQGWISDAFRDENGNKSYLSTLGVHGDVRGQIGVSNESMAYLRLICYFAVSS